MQTKDLDYFIKLVDEKNYSRVANDFNVSQPTISYAVKRLEEALGAKLVLNDPGHHTLSITDAGRQFYQRAQVATHQLELAKSEIKSASLPKIRLGLPPILGTYFFPKFVTTLQNHQLLDKIDAYTTGSSEALQDLLNGTINMAVLGSTDPLNASDLETKLLAEFPFVIVAPENSSFVGDSISFKDAAKNDFITFEEGFVHNRVFSLLEHSVGVNPNIIFKTTEAEILKRVVAAGGGIALLTKLAVTPNDKLKVLTLTDSFIPTFKIYVTFRTGYVLDENEAAFIDIISNF
ncbi:LysR family transcriptional regulator [Lentilactobacillus sp. SPB1-3]|uniref:LysR family transcriptional regulator n=1 Tax=Lentilactobacillus terminaliae TaxID=3003483 RepID=A0ACD5DE75_9LACO|nr:LysR family transcriptional regulator [Lentilactobacillus sp. SPB1-3]MCZ0977599.1 LysR family transcriptional regulator [Lentilactobacillus sp. SPB1-3]